MKLIPLNSELIAGYSYCDLQNPAYSMQFSNHGSDVLRVDVYRLRPDQLDLSDDLDKTG